MERLREGPAKAGAETGGTDLRAEECRGAGRPQMLRGERQPDSP